MKKLSILLVVSFTPIAASLLYGGSATWSANPPSNIWTSATNWQPTTVPNGPADTASFGISNVTHISVPDLAPDGMGPDFINVDSVVFNPGASAYTISVGAQSTPFTASLNFSGAGIINNSGIAQNLDIPGFGSQFVAGRITFSNSASAGALTTFANARGEIDFSGNSTAATATFHNQGFSNPIDAVAVIQFSGNSTADHATFTNGGGTNGPGAVIFFSDSASAGSAMFTNEGGPVFGPSGARTIFSGNSTASNGIFVNNGAPNTNLFGGFGGASTEFTESSTAQNATLIANGSSTGGNGGAIHFADSSTGGTARVEVFGDAFLDIAGHAAPGLTIGSLEGTGNVFLGSNALTVGSNNLNTTFSGILQDGGPPNTVNGGTWGSVTKIGSGTLTLAGPNTYTGPTTVDAGKLVVNGSITSSVTVNPNGALGGGGTIDGDVLNKGLVAPGDPKVLSITGDYVQDAGAILRLAISGTDSSMYDHLLVGGSVVLLSGSILDLNFTSGFAPHMGDIFDLIIGDGSISGDFSTINIDGLAPGFRFSLNDINGTLQLLAQNNGVASVPDMGSSVTLLGLALFALGCCQRTLRLVRP
jgi:autotransporter-associated beta strand protein